MKMRLSDAQHVCAAEFMGTWGGGESLLERRATVKNELGTRMALGQILLHKFI